MSRPYVWVVEEKKGKGTPWRTFVPVLLKRAALEELEWRRLGPQPWEYRIKKYVRET